MIQEIGIERIVARPRLVFSVGKVLEQNREAIIRVSARWPVNIGSESNAIFQRNPFLGDLYFVV